MQRESSKAKEKIAETIKKVSEKTEDAKDNAKLKEVVAKAADKN